MKRIQMLCLASFILVVSYSVSCAAQAPTSTAGQTPPAQPASSEVQTDLDAKRINFSFENTPIAKLLKELRQLVNVNILYYPVPEEEIPITVDFKDVTLRSALDTVCKLGKHDLDFDVIEGAVVVADKPTLLILRNKKPVLPAQPTPEETETIKKLDTRVDFQFEDTPMKEAVAFLGSLAQVQIVAELPHEGEFKNVHLQLARVTLRQALFHLSGLKFNFGVFGNQIVLSSDVGLALRKAK